VPGIERVDAGVGAVFAEQRRRDRTERSLPGRRARSLAARRGKYARHRLAPLTAADVAVDATLRAAAARTGSGLAFAQAPPALERRGMQDLTPRVRIEPADLRHKVREHRSPFAVCFVLDNSWSVHADQTVEKVKGVVFRLLQDSTGRGDRVALVAFRGGLPQATVALPFTSSLTAATRRLRRVPLSGQTPLADAIRRARVLMRQELSKHPNGVPLVVVVTDGEATMPLRAGNDPAADALAEARAVRRAGIRVTVIDTGGKGGAARLAEAAGGAHVSAADLTA
jgi:magnesium chelatase subunit D